jgi:hypothetical protein
MLGETIPRTLMALPPVQSKSEIFLLSRVLAVLWHPIPTMVGPVLLLSAP